MVTTLGASAAVSAEEERRHFEESKRTERQSLELAVEDKIRRQVKQVLDTAQVGAAVGFITLRTCARGKVIGLYVCHRRR